jgi:PAS domain S-box-containing protein
MTTHRDRIIAPALASSSQRHTLWLIAGAFLAAFLLDLLYLFSLTRMVVATTPTGLAQTTFFWLVVGLLATLAMLWLGLRSARTLGRSDRNRVLMASLVLISLITWGGIWRTTHLPPALIADSGLTSLEVGVEYLVIAFQLAAAALLIWQMQAQPPISRLGRAPAMAEIGETFFHALADHSQVALWMTMPDCQRILYINPTCAAVWGRETAQMLAEPELFWEALHPDDRASMRAAMAQSCSGRVPIEHRIVRPDGALRWIETRIFPVRDAAGNISGIAGMAIDVSDRKQREEERLAQEQRAQEARQQESLKLLAIGVAHNFNNLLQIILGYIDLSLDTLTTDSPTHSLIAPIQAAGQRATALTRLMLAFSGKGHSLMQPLVLNDVLATLSGSLRPPANDTIAMQVQLDPKLPPITADIKQIQQIIEHLAANAVEAIGAGPGGIALCTSLRHYAGRAYDLPEGDYVALEVADTGCGMDAATRAQMFEPFFSTKFTGRGLGLAAVQGIVREHGGTIHVASAPGQGTTMTVLFPLAPTIEIPVGVRLREGVLR